jgi:ADP-heptose:LPS heptosyltransferase
MGLGPLDNAPLVWTRPEDVARAIEIIESNALIGRKILSFYPGAQHQFRVYEKYQPVLNEMVNEGWRVIGFGSNTEFGLVNDFLVEIPGALNLCGKTSLTVAAELLRRSSLGLGSESSLSHIACAVGLNNVVILGGGHYGRFCPISRFTIAVVLPLSCFGCNWQCRFGRSHCVQEIHPGVVRSALDIAQTPSDFPRIVKDLVRPKPLALETLLDSN